jgi:ECF transporter S component (folate family)
MFYGPVIGGAFCAINEVVRFVFSREVFFTPMLFINSLFSGIIYGMFFYERDIVFWRIFLSKFCTTLFVNIVANSICLSHFVDENICLWFSLRTAKNIFLFPVEISLLHLSIKTFILITKKKKKNIYQFGTITSGKTF